MYFENAVQKYFSWTSTWQCFISEPTLSKQFFLNMNFCFLFLAPQCLKTSVNCVTNWKVQKIYPNSLGHDKINFDLWIRVYQAEKFYVKLEPEPSLNPKARPSSEIFRWAQTNSSGKYQNCQIVLKGSFWFFLVLFLVLFSSVFGFLVIFQFLS